MPVGILFASNEELPLITPSDGDEDAALEYLSPKGVAVAIVGYDLTRSPESWLTRGAVTALKSHNQWPYDPTAGVFLYLADGVSYVDLGANAESSSWTQLTGWFRHESWVVGVKLAFGRSADIEVLPKILASIKAA